MGYLPQFYDPSRVGKLVATRNNLVAAAGVEYAEAYGITPARDDADRYVLVIVDGQIDFIHPDGHLPVEGAVDDTRRTIEWLYNNIDKITSVVLSLDTHVPYQIFSPLYWFDRMTKAMPQINTIVSEGDYLKRFLPRFEHDGVANWNHNYIQLLKQSAQKDLMLWSIHCQIGSVGYSLEPSLFEAVLFWSAARQANPVFLTKGDDLYTEMYAIERAEVPNPTNPNTMLNTEFLDMIASYDRIYIVGQAKSHCVLETVNVAVQEFSSHASHVLPKIHLMMDAMSSVVVRDDKGGVIVDFEAICAPMYDKWAQLGLVLDNVASGNQPTSI